MPAFTVEITGREFDRNIQERVVTSVVEWSSRWANDYMTHFILTSVVILYLARVENVDAGGWFSQTVLDLAWK